MFTSLSRREALLATLGVGLGLTGCGGGGSDTPEPANVNNAGWNDITQMSWVDVVVGTGGEAGAIIPGGTTATVIYSGWVYDKRVANTKGTKVFDNIQFTWLMGRGRIFSGVEGGTTGMKVGGRRTVTAPASWCFGDDGHATVGIAPIPPKAALVLDIELLKVE